MVLLSKKYVDKTPPKWGLGGNNIDNNKIQKHIGYKYFFLAGMTCFCSYLLTCAVKELFAQLLFQGLRGSPPTLVLHGLRGTTFRWAHSLMILTLPPSSNMFVHVFFFFSFFFFCICDFLPGDHLIFQKLFFLDDPPPFPQKIFEAVENS